MTTKPTPKPAPLAALEDAPWPDHARRDRPPGASCTAAVCRCFRCGTHGTGVPHVPRTKRQRP
jgi:hypothetical protein